MEPLIITAKLFSGFVASDPWSPSIDGILAYWLMHKRLGDPLFTAHAVNSVAMQPVEGLPLAVERYGDDWWYQCSSPIHDKLAEHIRYFHRRFDTFLAERYMVPVKSRISIKAGSCKNYRLMLRVNITPKIQWHVIGDSAKIQNLLSFCSFIGAKTGQGAGEVISWEITPNGNPNFARYYRPLPKEFATQQNIHGPCLDRGIRPPGRIPQNQRHCVLPIKQESLCTI